MHPMGWDAFGLPAEQHAKKTGTPPRTTTEKNIATFRRQLKMLGFSYDWDRELATTDLDYFRWTQWIFLVLFDTWFDAETAARPADRRAADPAEVAAAGDDAVRRYHDEHRLAYQLEAPVNWCPALGTVLANEEVIGGVSERGGHPVVRIPLRQWMLRITAYADRLENDLDRLDWSESIKALQRNWIGRSTGAEVDFFIGTPRSDKRRAARGPRVQSLARRPRGRRFSAQARRRRAADLHHPARHALRRHLHGARAGASVRRAADDAGEQAEAVRAYCEQAARKSDLDRTDLAKEKTGVFTGSYAVNPVNGRPVPIWVADYVLISYGTGAIMAVPAHDTRDFEFAQKFEPADRGGGRSQRTTRRSIARKCWLAKPCSPATAWRSIRAATRACTPPSSSRRSRPTWPTAGSAAKRSTTSSATGSSAGSIFGASRFRSCTNWTPNAARPAASARSSATNCRSICPR